MPVFDSNCLYIIECLAIVFVVAPCVLFAGGMLICSVMIVLVISMELMNGCRSNVN